jgi:hypothetical protein
MKQPENSNKDNDLEEILLQNRFELGENEANLIADNIWASLNSQQVVDPSEIYKIARLRNAIKRSDMSHPSNVAVCEYGNYDSDDEEVSLYNSSNISKSNAQSMLNHKLLKVKLDFVVNKKRNTTTNEYIGGSTLTTTSTLSSNPSPNDDEDDELYNLQELRHGLSAVENDPNDSTNTTIDYISDEADEVPNSDLYKPTHKKTKVSANHLS